MSIKNEDVSDMPEEFYKSQFLSHQLKAISMQPDYRKTVDCGELLGKSNFCEMDLSDLSPIGLWSLSKCLEWADC